MLPVSAGAPGELSCPTIRRYYGGDLKKIAGDLKKIAGD
jgi:hypothetical protein